MFSFTFYFEKPGLNSSEVTGNIIGDSFVFLGNTVAGRIKFNDL